MSTQIVQRYDAPLRENMELLAEASKDLTLLGEELTVDFNHSKKIRRRAEELNVGDNIIQAFDQILRGQKVIAEDYKRLLSEVIGTAQLADTDWSRLQSAKTASEYNEAVAVWNNQLGSNTPMTLGENASICAKNTIWLKNMIVRVDAIRYSTYHTPEIASSTHDLVRRANHVPDIARRVQQKLVSFSGFLDSGVVRLPQADHEEFRAVHDESGQKALTREQAAKIGERLYHARGVFTDAADDLYRALDDEGVNRHQVVLGEFAGQMRAAAPLCARLSSALDAGDDVPDQQVDDLAHLVSDVEPMLGRVRQIVSGDEAAGVLATFLSEHENEVRTSGDDVLVAAHMMKENE